MDETARLPDARPPSEGDEPLTNNKRPRSSSNDLPPPKVAKTVPGNQGLQINYLHRLHNDNLPLASTDDSLPSLLRLITEYEGVLQRHESMAGNLGACPIGPILLKRFERLFDGPPHILKSHGKEANVTWLDVVDFARNKPEQFNLEKMRNGVRVCQFYTKQCRVEISEEDFVLIASGMPQKLIPPQPIMEDEEKELAAMQILEKNLGQIVQLADQLSGRARQLNHKLGNRRNAILRRRDADADPNMSLLRSQSSPMSLAETNGFSKQQQPNIEDQSQSPPSGFTAVNTRQSLDGEMREPDPRLERLYAEANAGNVTIINGRFIKDTSPALRAELLKKFFSSADQDAQKPLENGARRTSSTAAGAQLTPGSASKTRRRSESFEFMGTKVARGAKTVTIPGTSAVAIPGTPASLMPSVRISVRDVDDGGPFKMEMASRIEVMERAQRILPPCDRCRRLHMDCLKNLTACMGCTKKHAKCSWRDVRLEELQRPWGTKEAEVSALEAAKKDEEMRDLLTGEPSPTRDPSPQQPQSQSLSHPGSVKEAATEVKEDSPAQATPEGGRESEKPDEAEKPRFDVRPPPMAQQQANGRGQYNPFPFYSQVKDSIEHDENEEGDRLQALAAQVYRSQSVRPQTQDG